MRAFTSANGIKATRRQAQLEQYAWQNRRVLTDSEAVLWAELRGRKLGVQFRRQVPLCGRYVVDFYAPAAQLVVEVDGGYHHLRTGADARRDRTLRRAGYRVLRLGAALVLQDPSAAVRSIKLLLSLRL